MGSWSNVQDEWVDDKSKINRGNTYVKESRLWLSNFLSACIPSLDYLFQVRISMPIIKWYLYDFYLAFPNIDDFCLTFPTSNLSYAEYVLTTLFHIISCILLRCFQARRFRKWYWILYDFSFILYDLHFVYLTKFLLVGFWTGGAMDLKAWVS